MVTLGKTSFKGFAAATFGVVAVLSLGPSANAQALLDPKPISYQTSSASVDGYNGSFGVLGGSLDGAANGMAFLSLSAPIPYFSSFGIQGDVAYGLYDGVDATSSAAAALHIFWRDPGVGMLGIYGDWGYLSPVHSGRLGIEAAHYSGQWTFEGLFALEFGQNVYTKFVDEIDISYYIDDNSKVSFGHRFTARGNVANIGFEKQFGNMTGSALSFFAEAEAGEDDFYQVFAGIRASFGTGSATTMIGRDRASGVRVRIPRNLASITQCANVDNPFPAPNWLTDLHLITPGSQTETLCASKRSLNRVSSTGIFKP